MEASMQKGTSSLLFEHPVYITSMASVAGKKEGEGPLSGGIDVIGQDPMFGAETWEQAESAMQKQAADLALEKGDIHRRDIRYLFAGDLLGQLIATSFGTVDLDIPLFGLYGACSTIGEAISLGAMCVSAGYADRVLAMASSHYATAEKQFRFPLAYGSQRPQSTTWTVTGCGAVVLSANPRGAVAKVSGITTGRLVDLGTKDSMNMGAAMAPAAFDTVRRNFEDFSVDECYYDKIITGDLGEIDRRFLRILCITKGTTRDRVRWTAASRSMIMTGRIPIPAAAAAGVRL
jgi:stage V sporulation protein AD